MNDQIQTASSLTEQRSLAKRSTPKPDKYARLRDAGMQMAKALATEFNKTGLGAYNHARNAGFTHEQAGIIARGFEDGGWGICLMLI